MKVTLILPVAGSSSRFKGSVPKWLLTTPSNNIMIQESILQLNLKNVKTILIICLKEHVNKYINVSSIKKSIESIVPKRILIEICILKNPMSSQADTVYEGIKKHRIKGPIFIKDCDNQFKFTIQKGNSISSLNLQNAGLVVAKNKSYIELNHKNEVLRIVEKKVISNFFCTGGYGFESSKLFTDHFLKIYKKNKTKGEIYVSHVVQSMILNREIFNSIEVQNYSDFGTSEEWKEYQNRFITIICDVDGIFFDRGSKYLKKNWGFNMIESNIESFKNLNKHKSIFLIIVTSRPPSDSKKIKSLLLERGIKVNQFIGNVPNSTNNLIKKYSTDNLRVFDYATE